MKIFENFFLKINFHKELSFHDSMRSNSSNSTQCPHLIDQLRHFTLVGYHFQVSGQKSYKQRTEQQILMNKEIENIRRNFSWSLLENSAQIIEPHVQILCCLLRCLHSVRLSAGLNDLKYGSPCDTTTNRSINQSINRSFNQSINQSLNRSINQSINGVDPWKSEWSVSWPTNLLQWSFDDLAQLPKAR